MQPQYPKCDPMRPKSTYQNRIYQYQIINYSLFIIVNDAFYALPVLLALYL